MRIKVCIIKLDFSPEKFFNNVCAMIRDINGSEKILRFEINNEIDRLNEKFRFRVN